MRKAVLSHVIAFTAPSLLVCWHNGHSANALIDAAKTISVSIIFATLHCGFLRLRNGTVGILLDFGLALDNAGIP